MGARVPSLPASHPPPSHGLLPASVPAGRDVCRALHDRSDVPGGCAAATQRSTSCLSQAHHVACCPALALVSPSSLPACSHITRPWAWVQVEGVGQPHRIPRRLGLMPVMVKSKACHLRGATREQLVKAKVGAGAGPGTWGAGAAAAAALRPWGGGVLP